MPSVHASRIWNVDHPGATPEPVYWNRREFVRAAVLVGASAMGISRERLEAARLRDNETRSASLQAPPGSAFKPGPRNKRYSVARPVTDEQTAARFNNFYEFGSDKQACQREAQKLTVRPWTVRIAGLVNKPLIIDRDDLIHTMPCEERLYRFRCVERWAMVVPWSGFAFKALMDRVEPLSAAKYVRFVSFHRPAEAVGQRPASGWDWPYHEGLTIAEAANDLCFLATGIYGHDLPKQHGAPLRLVVPWKYGYKGPKSIVRIEFVDQQPRTFWNDYAPHEYGFYSNVDPDKPHPRWSQRYETMIGSNKRYPTERYNGYGEFVAGLYRGDEH